MKSILLLTGLLSISTLTYCQNKHRYSYLVINLIYDYDNKNDKGYFILKADRGNPDAQKIYDLVSYKLDKKTINPDGVLFTSRSQSDTATYNYFQNATEALLFLSNDGWELVSVISQVTSDYTIATVGGGDQVYTIVSSYPVYYLRKEFN